MSRLRYYFRTHFSRVTCVYQFLRMLRRNVGYASKFTCGKVKNIDSFFFVIDPKFKHPGLADRIKAIIACYNESKKNGLKFKIIFKEPFRLEDYLKPANEVIDWVADYGDLEYSISYTRFVNEIRGWNLRAHQGYQYHCYNYKGDIIPEVFEDTGYHWADLYNELFTPSLEIQRAIDATRIDAKTYVAIHLRFVNALECFEEGHYNRLTTEEEKEALMQRCRNGILDIKHRHSSDKIMVFSDSKCFMRSLDGLGVITLNSESVGHVCFDSNHEQLLKTFLDQYMISRAIKVYMITAPEMYGSSCFSLCGARIGGVKYETVRV